MLENLNREIFAPGQTIFLAGEEGDCAYLIEEGSVEICVLLHKQWRRVSLLGKGELIGEVALIDRQPRTATVRAVVKTVLVPIRRELIDELLEKTDPVIRHLLKVVLERFRTTQAYMVPRSSGDSESLLEYPAPQGGLHATAARNLMLAGDIAHALVADQFEMHYQPICHLAEDRVAGFEALIRWNHPREGMISPLDFLWLAEQTGQIRAIGLWTLERACRDWPKLRRMTNFGRPFVSVNLSANQLTGDQFVEEVRNILQKSRMDPGELKLELTETIIIGRPEIAAQVLNNLIELGSSLALDDFGTGYSGLDYLQRYPIGTLKIDRAFISHLLDNEQSLEIVRTSIELAHSLKMDVVAEGVETDAIRVKLLELGCNFGQGWFFGKPVALES
ncbi:MAG: EAL domain-containing protein [Methylococcaceae bacterium]|nr:MAG: EAL domain-containing protein [Methylococcaceae bacterium]